MSHEGEKLVVTLELGPGDEYDLSWTVEPVRVELVLRVRGLDPITILVPPERAREFHSQLGVILKVVAIDKEEKP